MKVSFRLIVLMLLLGGWALATAAVQVIRTPGSIPFVGGVTVIPKEHLSYQQTYIDTRAWTEEDFAAHPRLAERVKVSAIGQASQTMSSADAGAGACPPGASTCCPMTAAAADADADVDAAADQK